MRFIRATITRGWRRSASSSIQAERGLTAQVPHQEVVASPYRRMRFPSAISVSMRPPHPGDDVAVLPPLERPPSVLKRRTIHAPDRGAADRKVARVRARMLEQGQRLVA